MVSTSPIAMKPWQDPDATPFIEFRDVSKSFDGVPAVRNVNLEIYRK